jgi:hypothetical protein
MRAAVAEDCRAAAEQMRNPVKRYNPPKREIDEMMKPMKGWGLIAGLAGLLVCAAARGAASTSQWDRPCSELADQIVGILGPGQARLTIRNASTISTDEIPAIRRLLEQALKAHGVLASGTESANTIRVTLSENARERLWVVEIVEGNETRVAMVHVERGTAQQHASANGLVLRSQLLLTTNEPVLAALEIADSIVAVESEQIVVFTHSVGDWREQQRVEIGQKRPLTRDPRAVIFPSADGQGFDASVAGTTCSGRYQQAPPQPEWSAHCHESDDPWLLAEPQTTQTGNGVNANVHGAALRAFFNAARDYFTGVVTPSVGVELPPFYSAALLPRPNGAGLLINGIDGKVQLVESGSLKTVSGTRDWGSDFATLHSGCGTGTQIIASGSGEAITDSLRAYELPALEAIPASAPLAMEGTVTALWSEPDGKSVFAIVRKAAAPGQADSYEVDRVSANCN